MLRVNDISKSYGNTEVLRSCHFSLEKGEVLSILGRSGCGKTTLLKILSGLLEPDSGEIWLDALAVHTTPARERGFLYIYQEPMLFPHLNVWQNIAFGLKVKGVKEGEARRQAGVLIEELDLVGLDDRMPEELSGGQKQRVAFGRALILSPGVLLLDEPFGNLDAVTRAGMQTLFRSAANRHGTTSIFVTHDIREALTVGDRFAIMDKGEIFYFHEKRAFLADPRSGAGEERLFWRSQFDDSHEGRDPNT